MNRTSYFLRLFTAAAFLFFGALAQSQAQPSGVGACRQGVLALIGMLDAGEQSTADYLTTTYNVIETCGPSPARASGSSQINRAACRKLVQPMLDAIEDGKINTQSFVQVRNNFARSCAPKR
jgi:hypothetical protein